MMKEYFELQKEAFKLSATDDWKSYFSPGRVNLIGEHLDYNGGCVLPCALKKGLYGLFRRRNDNLIRAYSMSFLQNGLISFSLLDSQKNNDWTDYLKGLILVLNPQLLGGFDLVIHSTLPVGSGLSSSAALEMLVATYLNDEFNLGHSKEELALLSSRAENEYIGVKSGIMDQYIIGLGQANKALLLNTQNLAYEYVEIKLKGYSIVIANTNKQRSLITSEFNTRHEECKLALNTLQKYFSINHLCDLATTDLDNCRKYLDNENLFRRVRHVVSENSRVKMAKIALLNEDVHSLGEIFNQSFASLKDDYQVSCFELDTMVRLFQENGALGARLTGAGFGGCVVGLLDDNNLSYALAKIANEYYRLTNIKPDFYLSSCAEGVKKINPSIVKAVNELLAYGLDNNLFPAGEFQYRANSLIHYFKTDKFMKINIQNIPLLDDILEELLNHAIDKKLLINPSLREKANFKTFLSDLILPSPQVIIQNFENKYQISPLSATNYLYDFAIKSNYIQTEAMKKNIKWSINSAYGQLRLTINAHKPEKDPLEIIKEAQGEVSLYPQCQLCCENEGFCGDSLKDSRRNMRIIPLDVEGEEWYFQYSPYSYYHEHSIFLAKDHHPMLINSKTFVKLVSCVKKFPHYFVGSNADLPIVGGSILTHEHFQAGREVLPIEMASEEFINNVDEVDIYKLYWPLSTIRLKSKNENKLINYAAKILEKWQNYENKGLNIINSPFLHNTITPICRFREDEWIIDLILRNNFTTEYRPLGVFHPNPSLHHIKKENIGLIEAMGLAILPARLEDELKAIAEILFFKKKLYLKKALWKHKTWIKELQKQENTNIYNEVGKKFSAVLEDAGVFKQDKQGQEAFLNFIKSSR